MGPHFFKCGKVTRERKETTPERELQWGRTFSSAESSSFALPLRTALGASMGPHFFKCGKQAVGRISQIQRPASMGPHFFKCGKVRKTSLYSQFARASMGPHFFKCGKMPEKSPLNSLVPRFNGAALFQVRKVAKEAGIPVARLRRFNGAALFQVRKVIPVFPILPTPQLLQWGRTFSSAERLSDAFNYPRR